MSDRQIEQAKQLAISEGTLDAWLYYEMVLGRFSEISSECFYHIKNLEQEALAAFSQQYAALREEMGVKRIEVFNQLYPNPSDQTYENKKVVSVYIESLYEGQYDNFVVQEKDIRKDFQLRDRCTRLSKGAMVMYENRRARAKFEDGEKEKVPLFTYGIIEWMGQTEWGWRIGVKTPEGRTFYSAKENFGEEVINAPYRYKELLSSDTSKDNAFEKDEAYLKQTFGKLQRGDVVTYKGIPVDVVWCGKSWRDGRINVGLRITERARTMWVPVTEVSVA